MDYDVSKLKFDISIMYDCDEGEGCSSFLEEGTYEEAVALFNDLESRTWIDCYYHFMAINEFTIRGENGKKLDLDKILDGEYSWIADYCTSSKTEASKTPAACLELLEDLKVGKDGQKAKRVKALKQQIEELENKLATCKAELARLEA